MGSASPASKKATTPDDDRTQLPTPLQSPAPAGSRSTSGSSQQEPFLLETHAPSPSSDIEDADPILEFISAETEVDDEGYTTALDPGNLTATTITTTVNSSALYHMRYRYGDTSTITTTHRRQSSRGTSARLCRHCGSLHRSHKNCRTVRVVHEHGLTKDFFLIIVLCFVAAVLLICILRPPTIWFSLYRDTLSGLHPDRIF